MQSDTSTLRSVREAFPELAISSVSYNDAGQNSDVLVINEHLVLRFPRYPHVLERLKTETAILAGIQNYVQLAVPFPVFMNLEEQDVGKAFMGYHMIPGEPLWRETFRGLRAKETRNELAAQLGGFLNGLHAVPYGTAIDCEIPQDDTYEECVDIYTRIREKLFDHMRPDAQQWATRHFEGFLEDAGNFAYEPVLKHGDFGTSNILFDGETQRVSGIIDFGMSALGDPAGDLAGLLSSYGVDFLRRCARAYGQIEPMMGRVWFYYGTFALLEALFGIENGDDAAFQAGIEQYV